MTQDRRHFSRVGFSSNVFVKFEDQLFETELIDISLKGALIRSSEKPNLKKGNACSFELRLDQTDITLKIESLVVYDQEDQIGLRFDNLDLESMIHLRRLVELNVGDPDKIKRELFFLVNPR